MSDLTIRDLQDSWACKHVQGELSPEQRRVEMLELLDEVRADAWDEGRTAGNAYEADVQKWHRLRSSRFLDDMPEYPDKPRNPYRADQMEGDDGD